MTEISNKWTREGQGQSGSAPVVNPDAAVPTENKDEFSGFIFMCSGMTKPECYINRVFGLPYGRRGVVEKIKPGMKLFLYDFDHKLLYGLYEAASNGGMNLQPTAFGGRFPAQVQFSILKDCLPVPLSSFRNAIKDNYKGSKFACELNDQQVKDLTSLFNPIDPPSSDSLPATVLNAGQSGIAPVLNPDGDAPTQNKDEFSGFIYMCSGMTKPECYINRVFGLPYGRREVVEKIKPGMKLFLYDFDLKLLYGLYEAASNGGMNLQPTAFGGRFPAQVQFSILKDCLPVPLSSFRNAIKDNFQGSKFACELNDQQVKDLTSLFNPIVSSSVTSLLTAVLNGALGTHMLPPPNAASGPNGAPDLAINGWVNPSLPNPPSQNRYRPYQARALREHSQQMTLPHQFVQNNGSNQHLYHHDPYSAHQGPPAHVNPYQFVENQPPYLSHELPKTVPEPYPRYMTMPQGHLPGHTAVSNSGYDSLAPQPVHSHVDTRNHGQDSYPTSAPLYGLPTLPAHSIPEYGQAQPSSSRGS